MQICLNVFEGAKSLAANPIGITEPKPNDQLYTFSDYSVEKNAIGGRLIIIRETESGPEELVGGFFSAFLASGNTDGWHVKARLPV